MSHSLEMTQHDSRCPERTAPWTQADELHPVIQRAQVLSANKSFFIQSQLLPHDSKCLKNAQKSDPLRVWNGKAFCAPNATKELLRSWRACQQSRHHWSGICCYKMVICQALTTKQSWKSLNDTGVIMQWTLQPFRIPLFNLGGFRCRIPGMECLTILPCPKSQYELTRKWVDKPIHPLICEAVCMYVCVCVCQKLLYFHPSNYLLTYCHSFTDLLVRSFVCSSVP